MGRDTGALSATMTDGNLVGPRSSKLAGRASLSPGRRRPRTGRSFRSANSAGLTLKRLATALMVSPCSTT